MVRDKEIPLLIELSAQNKILIREIYQIISSSDEDKAKRKKIDSLSKDISWVRSNSIKLMRVDLDRYFPKASEVISQLVKIGCYEATRAMLSFASENQQIIEYQISDSCRTTPLHLACRASRIDLIQLIIKNQNLFKCYSKSGAKLLRSGIVECRDSDKASPLEISCQSNDVRAVELFINSGFSVNVEPARNVNDRKHSSPLQIACSNGNLELVRLLIKNGANVNARTSYSPIGANAILIAVNTRNLEIASYLMGLGCDISMLSEKQQSAIAQYNPLAYFLNITKSVIIGNIGSLKAKEKINDIINIFYNDVNLIYKNSSVDDKIKDLLSDLSQHINYYPRIINELEWLRDNFALEVFSVAAPIKDSSQFYLKELSIATKLLKGIINKIIECEVRFQDDSSHSKAFLNDGYDGDMDNSSHRVMGDASHQLSIMNLSSKQEYSPHSRVRKLHLPIPKASSNNKEDNEDETYIMLRQHLARSQIADNSSSRKEYSPHSRVRGYNLDDTPPRHLARMGLSQDSDISPESSVHGGKAKAPKPSIKVKDHKKPYNELGNGNARK